MKIGVRISNGTAIRYPETMTEKELKKMGYRPATFEEIKKYWSLKLAFDTHKIKCIKLF